MSKFQPRHKKAPETAAAARERVAAVRALIDGAPRAALKELERGLRWHLYKPLPASARRLRELAFLRTLVSQEQTIGGDLPYIERTVYDSCRPTDAYSSDRLQKRYGSWAMACFAASVLDEQGIYRNGVQNPPLDRRLVKYGIRYELDECLNAIRECAAELGRTPSSQDYVLWRRLRCAALRARGITPRIPHCAVIYRFFPRTDTNKTRWSGALEAALLPRIPSCA